MKFRSISGLFIMLIVCSCSQQTPKSGLLFNNGINRGISLTDSLGTKYNLRYIPITINNDSTVQIQLQLTFLEEFEYPVIFGDEKFKVIPLPKEWTLDGVEITESMINEIPKYINKPSINKIIEPNEKFVLSIGTVYPSSPKLCGVLPNLLFTQNDRDNFQSCDVQMELNRSTNPQLAILLKLVFCVNSDAPGCSLISCGKISYPENY